MNLGNKLTATQVAAVLGITVPTLNSWYSWYLDNEKFPDKPKDLPQLPMYLQDGPFARRLWKIEDIDKLKIFHNYLPKGRAGIMGDKNARSWGDRGIRALENKNRTDLVQDYFGKEVKQNEDEEE